MGRIKRVRKAKMARRRFSEFRKAILVLNTFIRKMDGTFGPAYKQFRDQIRKMITR